MNIPLKVTTDYSILKSIIKIDNLIKFCLLKNIKVCGICDNNLCGVVEFYQKCLQNNIKPLIGLEVNINNEKVYLYAKNYLGYKNLLKINTIICEKDISIIECQKYSNDILVIIPYMSKDIYNDLAFFEDIYIGYQSKEEYQNGLLITNNIVYVNDIKALDLASSKYLKYLDIMSDNKPQEYLNNYYQSDISQIDYEKELEVVNKLNIEINIKERYIPKYIEDSYNYLTNLCIKGLKKRLNNKVPKSYIDRLKYELNVINKMGFVDYFLIVYDYVLYAKKNNILVGPGRGSAAGSLVSYVIGITDIDPLKYNLLFERFLNYERVTMPDIDIDFESTKREDVINYVKNKYGSTKVAGGITFATLKTRLVLREVAKILKIDEQLLNKFLRVVDRDKTLSENLQIIKVKEYLNSYPNLKELYQISMQLEGLKRNISTHAAGIVIANKDLDEIIPMYKNKDVYLTGVPMEYLEDLGLLKMDFLALRNLSTISNIINKIPNFKLNNIPLDDPKVYELFCNANTDGIFQFETKTFKNMLVKFKPKNFLELVASIALVRPGPVKELETYIRRKEGLEKVSYYDNSLIDILKETYGVIVYQEQVISILVKMASFSYAEADNIRRAMAKKKEKIILNYQNEFINRCMQNGYSKSLATNIYNHIIAFASYGFNKAHSVAYASISYEMAYLKVHYPALFTFELLDMSTSNDKIKEYLNDLKRNNYYINYVSINYSLNNFVLKEQNVYLPFKMIKNIKTEKVKEIITERNENGLYKDIFDFFKRTINFLNKDDYLILINSFSLRDFNINVKSLQNNLNILMNYGLLYNDLGEDTLIPKLNYLEDDTVEEERLREKDSYGFYISNHPASKYLEDSQKGIIKLDKIKENVFKNIICYVMVENIKNIKTKENEEMAFISASDETNICDFTIFPDKMACLKDIQKNDLIKVWGRVSKRYDKYSIIINKVIKE